jgi:1,4-dihydroxy-6-naphthoate synthase
VARHDLDRLADVSAVLSDAIGVGLEHRAEALEYARQYGRGIDEETTDRFVAMYVNELTSDYGEVGRAAVDELLRRSGTGVTAVYA